MKKIIFLLLLLSCACAESRKEITYNTLKLGAQKGLKSKVYETQDFRIFTMQKLTDESKPLRVYIEGDGKAFVTKYLASADPTPTTYFTMNLVAQDDSANIIYIARPCQYLDDKKCDLPQGQKYWTNARFSEEVVRSIEEVLRQFPQYKIELVGYSGGGAIAKYLAARNENVVSLRTIAGNLDHQKFSEIHNVSPLDESLSSVKDLDKLQYVAQIHFIGSNDEVVPYDVAKSYMNRLPKKNCVRLVTVNGATHSKGWIDKWKRLLEIVPACGIYK